jgi:hypothetical protein
MGLQSILDSIPERKTYRPLVEHDNSLSSHGVELIFPPMKLSTYKNKASGFRQVLEGIKDTTRTTGNTGMHVNINTYGWTLEQVGKYMAVIHNLPSQWLVNIGGRQLNRFCYQMPRQLPDYLRTYCARIHGYAIEYQGNRLEARFPSSTTEYAKIINLLSFFTLVKEFVFNHEDQWVAPNLLVNEEYPYYVLMLENFSKFLVSTKEGTRIGRILYEGYQTTG